MYAVTQYGARAPLRILIKVAITIYIKNNSICKCTGENCF